MAFQRALAAGDARIADVGLRIALTVDGHAGQAATGLASRERVVALDEILLTIASAAAITNHRRTAFAMFGFRARIAPMAHRKAFAVEVQRRRIAARTRAT